MTVMTPDDPKLDIPIDSDEFPDEEAPAAPPPRSSFKRWMKVFLIGCVAGAAMVVAALWRIDQILTRFKPELETWMRDSTGAVVEFNGLETHWKGLLPELKFADIHFQAEHSRVDLTAAVFTLDLSQSLIALQPKFGKLTIKNVQAESHPAATSEKETPAATNSAHAQLAALSSHLALGFSLEVDQFNWKGPEQRSASAQQIELNRSDLKAGSVQVEIPALWKQPLKAVDVSSPYSLETESGLTLRIGTFRMEALPEPNSPLSGAIELRWPDTLDGWPSMGLHLEAGTLSLSKLRELAPTALFPSSLNDWLTRSIETGQTESVRLDLSGLPSEWKEKGYKAFQGEKNRIELSIELSNTRFFVAEDFPKLENIKGSILIKQESIEAKITTADSSIGRLSALQARISDILAPKRQATLEGELQQKDRWKGNFHAQFLLDQPAQTYQLRWAGEIQASELSQPRVGGTFAIEGESKGTSDGHALSGKVEALGWSFDLPPPLAKKTDRPWPFRFEAKLTPARLIQEVIVLAEGPPRLKLHWRKDGEEAPSIDADLILNETWALDAWRDFKLEADAPSPSASPRIKLTVQAPRVSWEEEALTEVRAEISGTTDQSNIQLSAREAAGKMDWTRGATPATSKLKIDLARLSLRKSWLVPETGSSSAELDPPLPQAWKLEEWPEVVAKCDDFRMAEEKFGEWRWKLSHRDGTTHIDFARWTAPQFEISTRKGLITRNEDGEYKSEIDATLKLNQFSRETPFWKTIEGFSASSGELTAQLAWPGSLNQFRLKHTTGSIDGHLPSGQFRGVRSFIQSLFNTMSLNFADARKRLMRFDKMTLDLGVGGGRIQVREARALFGTVFAKLEGTVTWPERALDLSALVTPASTDLNEDEVGFTPGESRDGEVKRRDPKNSFTRRYKVSGTWDNPKF